MDELQPTILTDDLPSVPLSNSTAAPTYVSFLSGACASLSVDAILYPLDTLKTRIQAAANAETSIIDKTARGTMAINFSEGQSVIRKIKALRGHCNRTLFQGMLVACCGTVPSGALFFGTYEAVGWSIGSSSTRKDFTGENNSDMNSLQQFFAKNSALGHMISSAFGESAACLVRVPVEMVKQRQQVLKKQALPSICDPSGVSQHSRKAKSGALIVFQGLVEEAKLKRSLVHAHTDVLHSTSANTLSTASVQTPYRHSGGIPVLSLLRVLYRGYPVTLSREIPFSLIQMPLYEFFKASIRRLYHLKMHGSLPRVANSPPLANLPGHLSPLPGICAGGISAFITTPMDVLKTVIMTSSQSDLFAMSKMKNENILAAKDSLRTNTGKMRPVQLIKGAYAHIVKTRGYRGLFRGAGVRGVWMSAGGGIFFGMYEISKSAILKIVEN